MAILRFGFLALFLVLAGKTAYAGSDQETAKEGGAVKVQAEEISKLYLGHIVSGKTRKGYAYKTPIQLDGTIAANKRRGAGKFLVIDDQACMQFKGLWDDKPMCWSLYRIGEGKFQTFRKDGSLSADVEFMPLN